MVSRKNRRTSRKSRRASRKSQRGGGAGVGGYTFGGPVAPGIPIGNTAEVKPLESCLAVNRPGMVSSLTGGLGLPGMSGGARRRGLSRRLRQKGGRYGFDLSQQLTPAAPWAGGIPQVQRIACEGSTPNPLNPGPHTPSTQPPIQSGGAGGIDSAAYYAPTAGYSNTPSAWVGSTGAPSMIQTPYDARSLNPACLKTGGGRRKRRGSRRAGGRR